MLLIVWSAALAQVNDFGPGSPAFAPTVDQPGLPRVLLIGDSISIGYTVTVRNILAGKANVHRIPENGADTANGLKNIDTWLGDTHWDVIHFNWGLHDLKMTPAGGRQIPVESYEKNLATLVARLRKTGAKLIWATTTPVPEGKLSPPRQPADVERYNGAAARVMKANEIVSDDLHATVLPRMAEVQLPANVHFNSSGWELLGRQVASAIEIALEPRRQQLSQ
jgi:acyl-CoA thioesterase-1